MVEGPDRGRLDGGIVIAPGTYVVVGESHAWKSFTLYTDGRIEFVDAHEGHLSYSRADDAWFASMEKLIAGGELQREVSMRVAEAILIPAFLDGSAAIEYVEADAKPDDAYYIRQVSIARPYNEAPFTIERHRTFKAKSTDPWPTWHVIRGLGVGENGFYGLWLPHLETLLATCRLVTLADNDRVPSVRWIWIDNYRRLGHYAAVELQKAGQ